MDRAGVTMIAALLVAAGSAEAAEPGFYVAAGLGQAEQEFSESTGTLIAIGSPFGNFVRFIRPDAVSVEDDEPSWNGVLGYRINKYLAAELAYMDFGEIDVSEHYTIAPPIPFFPTELTRTFSSGIAGPAVSVLGSLPVGSQFDVFVRGGILFADKEITQGPAANPQSMTFGSEVWLGGAGIDWSFAKRWSVRLEYLRTGKTDANIVSGESDLSQFALSALFRL
jgi:opacity protein-like surface antigen